MAPSKKTVCKRGHALEGHNVIIRSGGPNGKLYRNCRICFNERRNAREKKRRDEDEEYRLRMNRKRNEARKRKKTEL